MQPRPLAGEHMGEEDALVDLDAVLVALVERGLGGNLLAARHQAGNGRRRGVDEVLDPDEAGPLAGQRVIDPVGMGGEEALPAGAGGRQDFAGRRGFRGVPLRLRRQGGEEPRGLRPERDVAVEIGIETLGRTGVRRDPLGDR